MYVCVCVHNDGAVKKQVWSFVTQGRRRQVGSRLCENTQRLYNVQGVLLETIRKYYLFVCKYRLANIFKNQFMAINFMKINVTDVMVIKKSK